MLDNAVQDAAANANPGALYNFSDLIKLVKMPYSIKLPDGSTVEGIPDTIDPKEATRQIAAKRPDLMAQGQSEGQQPTIQSSSVPLTQYLPLPDGSSLKVREGESAEQAWARAQQTYPEAFGGQKAPAKSSTVAEMVVAEPSTLLGNKPVDAVFVAIFFTVVAALLIVSILWARKLNFRHLIKNPECKPFAWGFYQATSWICLPPIVLLALRNESVDIQLIVLAILVLVFLPIMVMTIRRSKVGFILMTALSLNPLLWVINGIYLKNRWTEMAGGNPPANVTNDHFGKALLELDNGTRDNGLWAKCFAEAQGNESAAKAAYIKQRATELANPH